MRFISTNKEYINRPVLCTGFYASFYIKIVLLLIGDELMSNEHILAGEWTLTYAQD